MTPAETNDLGRVVNRINHRNSQRVERIVNAVATVLAFLGMVAGGMWLLIAALDPCHTNGHMCALLACTTPATRIGPGTRLATALRAAWLRRKVAWAQDDLDHYADWAARVEWERGHIQRQQAITRQHMDELRVHLIDCDLSTRVR